nr:hypothetical protein [Pandoravirus massiliensis]
MCKWAVVPFFFSLFFSLFFFFDRPGMRGCVWVRSTAVALLYLIARQSTARDSTPSAAPEPTMRASLSPYAYAPACVGPLSLTHLPAAFFFCAKNRSMLLRYGLEMRKRPIEPCPSSLFFCLIFLTRTTKSNRPQEACSLPASLPSFMEQRRPLAHELTCALCAGRPQRCQQLLDVLKWDGARKRQWRAKKAPSLDLHKGLGVSTTPTTIQRQVGRQAKGERRRANLQVKASEAPWSHARRLRR